LFSRLIERAAMI